MTKPTLDYGHDRKPPRTRWLLLLCLMLTALVALGVFYYLLFISGRVQFVD